MEIQCQIYLQAKSYIGSMPDYAKRPFSNYFLGANPSGKQPRAHIWMAASFVFLTDPNILYRGSH